MSDTTTYDIQDAMSDFDDAVFDARNVVAAHLRRIAPGVDVGDVDVRQPLREEAGLSTAGLAALIDAVRASTGISLPPDLVHDRTTLGDLADALATTRLLGRWQVDVTFTDEPPVHVSARARLTAGLDHLDATGDTRKHPSDPYDASCGHELAAARALAELATQLLALANDRIRNWDPEADPVTL